ncbi:MAG TPA: cyclic nucleotide-binding domain-containing protein [Candidatus Lustribacter sp.]|nr:cyclic nucleotide-binding domain-containing protein [Candidatus Lustribacter sp.]
MTEKSFDRIATTIYQAPVGQYIGREGAEVLARHAGDEVNLQDKEVLFRKGEHATTFYILTQGRLALLHEATKNRPAAILHVLEQGDLVGELSFIDGSKHTVSCCALGEASVLSFNVRDLTPLIDENPRVLYDFMRAVIMRVHHTSASISRQRQELADYISTGGRRF